MRHENEQPWPELRTVLLPESGEQSDSNDLAMTIRELLHGKAVSRLRKQRWWLKLVNLLKRGHLQIPESLAPRGNARIVTRKEALDIVEKTKREFGLGSVVLSGGILKKGYSRNDIDLLVDPSKDDTTALRKMGEQIYRDTGIKVDMFDIRRGGRQLWWTSDKYVKMS